MALINYASAVSRVLLLLFLHCVFAMFLIFCQCLIYLYMYFFASNSPPSPLELFELSTEYFWNSLGEMEMCRLLMCHIPAEPKCLELGTILSRQIHFSDVMLKNLTWCHQRG